MDTELIERLAREAGLVWGAASKVFIGGGSGAYDCHDELAKFAALVAEECAKAAEGTYKHGFAIHGTRIYSEKCAYSIRAKFAND